MKKALALVLWLSSCDSCLPEWFRATPKAGFERMAGERHQLCVQNLGCQSTEWCHAQSELFCLDAGYSETCGNYEREGSCGEGIKR